jgi:hypothetical protein
MSGRIPSITFAILLGMCAGADASEVLAGGPLYGADASQGGGITCRVFNSGNSRIRFIQNRIFDNTGAEVPLFTDTCTVLAPTKTCAYGTVIAGNLAYSCRSITNDTTNSLTGTIEILNHDHNAVVQQQPLRSNELQR